MIFKAKLLTTFETAHFLQNHLGSLRQWSNFLADNIRGKQNIEGFTLMPRARLQSLTGYGPAYLLEDIAAFILAVRAAVPGVGAPIVAVKVQLDPAKGWRVNKFDRAGNPVANLRTVQPAWMYRCG